MYHINMSYKHETNDFEAVQNTQALPACPPSTLSHDIICHTVDAGSVQGCPDLQRSDQ